MFCVFCSASFPCSIVHWCSAIPVVLGVPCSGVSYFIVWHVFRGLRGFKHLKDVDQKVPKFMKAIWWSQRVSIIWISRNHLEKRAVSLCLSLTCFSTIIGVLFGKIIKLKKISSKKGVWEKVSKGNDHIVGLSIKGGSNPRTTETRWPSSMAFWKDLSRLNIHCKRTSLKVRHLNRTTRKLQYLMLLEKKQMNKIRRFY